MTETKKYNPFGLFQTRDGASERTRSSAELTGDDYGQLLQLLDGAARLNDPILKDQLTTHLKTCLDELRTRFEEHDGKNPL